MKLRRLGSAFDSFGNICTRLTIPRGGGTISCGFVIEDPFLPGEVLPHARQVPVAELPDEILLYLLGSRYCETDRLSDMGWSVIGGITPGWAMVDAIVTYTHKRIRFDYRQGRPTKSAWDAHEEQVGVCRDCPSGNGAVSLYEYPRALLHGLYGRYGLPAIVGDMDFSAWFEAYLGGAGLHSMPATIICVRAGY